MTIATTTNRVSFAGNGSTTVFPFPYYFLAQGDLVVILRTALGVETVKTLTTHYTVSGAGSDSGGSVTMLTPPATGESLTIYNDLAATQGTDWRENDSSPAETLETALDRATMLIQRLDDRMDRAVRKTEGFTGTFDPRLPAVITADAMLQFNLTGDGFSCGPTAAQVASAETYAEAASNSADDAATSATAAAASATAAAASATSASSSATTATTQATNSATSATSASTFKDLAQTAAGGAATSASAASNSASAAATSASAASTSASSASTSASTATTQAGNASTSASAAAASASGASTSATNASTSATASAASAASAAATLASALWRDVVFLTSADSPRTVAQADNGKLLVCDTSGGAVVINLPQISDLTPPFSCAVKLETGANTVTINRAGTDTIDGSNTRTLTQTATGCQLLADTDPSPDKWTAIDFGATVTSVTFTGDGTILSSTPSSAVTTTGTVTATLKSQTANTILAGPGSGSAANPTFRLIASADFVAGSVSPSTLQNLGLSVTASAGTITVALKQADGSTDPAAGAGAVNLAFRDSTAANGNYALRPVTAANSLSLTGARTLGGASGVAYYVNIYAFDNGGAITLGASLSLFDEGSVQSSSTTATSNQVIYQGTALTSKPVRLIGRFKATNTTSSWGAPTEVSLAPFDKKPVVAVYNTTAGDAMTNAVFTRVNYATKVQDTHNCVTTGAGTWAFTSPITQFYQVNARATVISAVAGTAIMRLVAAGAEWSRGPETNNGAGSGFGAINSDVVFLTAGQTLYGEFYEASGANRNLNGSATANQITIVGMGNY